MSTVTPWLLERTASGMQAVLTVTCPICAAEIAVPLQAAEAPPLSTSLRGRVYRAVVLRCDGCRRDREVLLELTVAAGHPPDAVLDAACPHCAGTTVHTVMA